MPPLRGQAAVSIAMALLLTACLATPTGNPSRSLPGGSGASTSSADVPEPSAGAESESPIETSSPVTSTATALATASTSPGRPTPGSCRSGARVIDRSPQTLYSVPGAGNEMALTFDMGGRLDPAIQIMNLLIASRVCATIFPTGAMSQTAQGGQVLAIIRAHPELFEVGNHTMHHCDLVRGGLGSPTTAPCATGGPPSASFTRSELTDAAAILRAATGQDPAPYWRPPYGSFNGAVLAAAASVGYPKTLMWSIDTVDWKPVAGGGPTASQIAANVVDHAAGGSVVLMHLGGYNTLDALRSMIPALRGRGMLLTSVSDLLDGH